MLRSLKNSKGFTLIELVMVIVILGVLAAVAVPKFTDLQHRAYLSSEQGIVGGVRSGIAVFAASAIAGGTIDTAGSAATINGYAIPCLTLYWDRAPCGLTGAKPTMKPMNSIRVAILHTGLTGQNLPIPGITTAPRVVTAAS